MATVGGYGGGVADESVPASPLGPVVSAAQVVRSFQNMNLTGVWVVLGPAQATALDLAVRVVVVGGAEVGVGATTTVPPGPAATLLPLAVSLVAHTEYRIDIVGAEVEGLGIKTLPVEMTGSLMTPQKGDLLLVNGFELASYQLVLALEGITTSAALPGMTLTPEPDAGRIRIELFYWATGDYYVRRTDPGAPPADVRNATPLKVSGGGAVLYDHEAPVGRVVTYTVTGPGTATTVVATGTVQLDTEKPFLVHTGDPSLSVATIVQALDEKTRTSASQIHDVLNRQTPVPIIARRRSSEGVLTLLTDSLVARDAMWRVLDDGSVLQLKALPDDCGLGTFYFLAFDVTERRPFPRPDNQTRLFDIPFREVARPSGASFPAVGSRYSDAKAAYATYDVLWKGERDYRDLLEGAGTTAATDAIPPPIVDHQGL